MNWKRKKNRKISVCVRVFAYISNACFCAFNNMGTASQEGTFSSSPLVLNQVDFKSKTLWWTFENFCQVGAWRCVSVYLWPLTQSSIFLSFRWLSSSVVKLQMNNNRVIQNKLWKLSWNKMFSLFNTIAFNLLHPIFAICESKKKEQ